MSADSRVARVIAQFWRALQGAGKGVAVPDDTDVALAAYLAKHKIGVIVGDATRGGGNLSENGEEDDMGRSIMDMIGEQITKAWEKHDQLEEALADERDEASQLKVARGRIRGLAHALAIMRSAPQAVTAQMIKEIEEEYKR